MIVSILSSFEQKLNFSKAYNNTHETKQQQVVAPLVADRQDVVSPSSTCTSSGDLIKKAREASPPSSARQQQHKRQRFAPEFDGVHCFETIIPY
ncbi:hypothetical protein P3S67_006901 [Capsicum chacoense]